MRVPRVVRNTLLSAVILAALFAAAGVLYVKFGGGPPAASKTKPVAAADNFRPLPKPPKPSANASEGVAIESLDSPVSPGDNTSITVRTLPTSKCTISVTYGNTAAKDSGLAPKTPDIYGFATWSWTVDPTAPAGSWPVKVICSYHGRWAQYIGSLQVK